MGERMCQNPKLPKLKLVVLWSLQKALTSNEWMNECLQIGYNTNVEWMNEWMNECLQIGYNTNVEWMNECLQIGYNTNVKWMNECFANRLYNTRIRAFVRILKTSRVDLTYLRGIQLHLQLIVGWCPWSPPPLKQHHMVMAQCCNYIFDSFHEEKYTYIWSMGKFLIQVGYQSLNPKIHLVYFWHLHILIYYWNWRFHGD